MKGVFKFLSFVIILETTSFIALKIYHNNFQAGKVSDFSFTDVQKEKTLQFLDEGHHYRCFDSSLGWMNKPTTSVSQISGKRNINININEDGFRANQKYKKIKDWNVTRILALGDSFTFGSEVDDLECWSSILECQESNLEVLNAGVPGFGLDQSLLYFNELKKTWNPDVVIVSYMTMIWMRHLNTFPPFRNKRSIPLSKPRFILKNGKLNLIDNYLNSPQKYQLFLEKPNVVSIELGKNDYFYSTQFGSTSYQYGNFANLMYLLLGNEPKQKSELYVNGYYNKEHDGFRITVAILDEFVNVIREVGAKPIILFFPATQDIKRMQEINKPAYRVYKPLYEKVIEMDVNCFDFASEFCDLEGDLLFEKNGHYSPFANKIIANKIIDLINSL